MTRRARRSNFLLLAAGNLRLGEMSPSANRRGGFFALPVELPASERAAFIFTHGSPQFKRRSVWRNVGPVARLEYLAF